MNISPMGSDISRLRGAEAVPGPNGKSFNPLESSKVEFRDTLTKNTENKPEPKTQAKQVRLNNYKKGAAGKSNMGDDIKGVKSPEVSGPNETKSHASPTTVEKYDEIETSRPTVVTEEGAMVNFLTAMQKEVGVEPQKVVEAMVSLDAESMMKPPEETMTQILENLEIPPEKMARAEELYQKMLMDTAEAAMGKMLRENDQTVAFKVMGPEQLRMQKLMKSVDELQANFFDPKRPAVAPLISNEQLALNAMSVPAEGQIVTVPAGGEQAMAIEDLMAQLNAQGFQAGQESVMSASSQSDGTALANGESESESDSETSEELPAEFSPLLAGANGKKEILGAATATPGAPVIKSADEIANQRQIVESAQLLAQKGGGSMKLQLKPEGLGYVELNVGVNNGKVDIQMTTENNEVKRLLESGLGDLKAGLVQHKLSLENVQVDTGNRTQTGLETMLGQDRDTAREFLESFREFNQNRRQAGFDFANVAGYASSAQKGRRLTPTDTRYANAKKSAKRLDLVA